MCLTEKCVMHFKKRIIDIGMTDYDAEALIQEIESKGKKWPDVHLKGEIDE